ncbi:MAG TPA: EscU/YscU/HrcU family type III secretion system export apparatus switch protein [Thiobacillus sp.]|nr:MAG: flagellar biosynthesis protein FlhB [Hydrogenophilales bacterium 28-61-11]OYZ57913.1 MAG: flagellar biosynthesis protein FlhB [Hydrogenophilales bacterium 16-61-112]OZA51075.1 MAG: flagellar biosynthesis protein FlhB [Hydrogenophilales bacterium 17-61-76]HQT30887.1 EscU/YscU/HrcU family type III secretion system export apparatus switch protein [Thiobacillus sp.]HQT70137.1 EscU/YscU/HrcU family type III secretion system export apparatus switch protein [Thiobacillus sp.]
MAEESDLSRTEPASSQRLQQARKAGDVPRSAELTAWVVLLAALGMLGWLMPRLLAALQNLTESAFISAARPFSRLYMDAVQSVLWAVLPLLLIIMVASLAAPMLISGWVFAPQQTQFNLLRVNVFKVLLRLFSADFWFDGLLAVLKLVLLAVAIFWILASGEGVQGLAGLPLNVAFGHTAAWLERGLLGLATALALVAALDVGWRWWRYLRRHAMNWQDVLAEAREAEVSPEVRAQLRDRQQQAGQPALAEGAATLRPGPQSINEVIG